MNFNFHPMKALKGWFPSSLEEGQSSFVAFSKKLRPEKRTPPDACPVPEGTRTISNRAAAKALDFYEMKM
jgi:hypothetical protein